MARLQNTVTQTDKLNMTAEGTEMVITRRSHDRLPMICYRHIRGGQPIFTPKPRARCSTDPKGPLTTFEVTWQDDKAVQENDFQGYGVTVRWGDTEEGTLFLGLIDGTFNLLRPAIDYGYTDAVTGRLLTDAIVMARVVREDEWMTEAQVAERD